MVVHGDVEGVDGVRRSLCDWLSWMHLVPAGRAGSVGRYVGFYEPYATSHEALDADVAIQEEVRNAARSLITWSGISGPAACRRRTAGSAIPGPSR